MLDIFTGDAFSVVPLTMAIERLKYLPGRINQLGIFSETGISTTRAGIEQRDGQLYMIPPTPRGGPGVGMDKRLRNMRVVAVPHFQIDDAVMAEEVQGVRAWGNETAVQTVMDLLAERGQLAQQSFEFTTEYARIGAIKGLITYADGTTLDTNQLFGVTRQPTQFLNLNPVTPSAPGLVRRKIQALIRSFMDNLGAIPFSGIRGFCGNAFFDNLIADPDVRTTYLNWQGAEELRQTYITPGQMIYGAFPFGGINFENYRGAWNSTPFVEDDLCYLIPEGVPDLFRTILAPADYNETVNTIGRPIYAKQWPMPNDKGINLEFQMNRLHICTRPALLLTVSRLAS